MEKDLFIEVLKDYSEISEAEALEVVSLKEIYPYSQVLHALSARLSKDHEFSDQQRELQLAAVYAADRSVLKDVMTLDAIVVAKPSRRSSPPVKKSLAPKSEPVPPEAETSDSDGLAEEVMHDLEKLHQLRHNFEMMFADSESKGVNSLKEPELKAPQESEPTQEVSKQKESAKSKKERIIALARSLEGSKESVVEDVKPIIAKKKKENPGENIIEEIVSSKQEIVPENDKQKEQLEIIDHFIKTQPTISNAKDKIVEAPAGDLATIKTGEFGDNIVSETLVEILIKQGKKDKAIEVLKKLIWKFPQKKAYFAAQIEELKS